ncbi:MAG: hypothetical protein CMI30_07585 [Opitutae bacterium]|nr:hypothetical protein [Opitutae bacterium]
MKKSHRHEVVVVGAGLAGICAAVTAAREGVLVALIEAREQLGGRVGPEARAPMHGADRCNFAYARETGLVDEILLEKLRLDPVGSYETWDRVLRNLVRGEPKLDLFEGMTIVEATSNDRGDRVESILGNGMMGRTREKFRGRTFIDCTGDAILSQFLDLEMLPERDDSASEKIGVWTEGNRLVTHMRARKVAGDTSFVRPEWIRIDWEQNEVAPRVAFAEALLAKPEDVVAVEWAGEIPEAPSPDAREIVYAAWDFVKNHSKFKDRARNYELSWISPILLSRPGPRIAGDHVLTVDEMKAQTPFHDAVATGGAGFAGTDTFTTSPLGHVEQPGPFVVPLRSLYPKKMKNLFVAGGHASVAPDGAFGLQAPLTSAVMGEAVGVAAATATLAPHVARSLAKEVACKALRTALLRRNHDVWDANTVDPDDLVPKAEISVSSTLSACSCETADRPLPISQDNLVVQFPANTRSIDSVSLLLNLTEKTELEATLLAGPANGSTIPSQTLAETSIVAPKGKEQWVEFPFESKTARPGWRFLKVKANDKIVPHLKENAPVGAMRLVPRSSGVNARNPYANLQHALPASPGPASSLCFKTSPPQAVYDSSNLSLPDIRPDSQPNLWISQPTDFKYPEWIEARWPEPQVINRVDLVFDASLEYRFPTRPEPSQWNAVSSIVRSYRLLAQNPEGKWDELYATTDNYQGFRSHCFKPVKTNVLELEIRGTHGLDRAQVYAIRAYES